MKIENKLRKRKYIVQIEIKISIVLKHRKKRDNLKVSDRMFKSSTQILYLRAMFLIVDNPPEFAFVAVNRQIGFHRLYYAKVLLLVGVVL